MANRKARSWNSLSADEKKTATAKLMRAVKAL